MSEFKELVKSITILLTVSLVTFVAVNFYFTPHGDFIISNYEAHLTRNGILYENYTYIFHKSGKYHMMYRHWNTPLFYGHVNEEGIYLLNISFSDKFLHAIPYVKSHYSGIYILGNVSYNSEDINYIATKANKSEAGIYVPSGIPAGKYIVSYVFLIYPILEKGDKFYHFTFNLGSSHPEYYNAKIEIPRKFDPIASPYLYRTENSSLVIFRGDIREYFPIVVDLFLQNVSGFSYKSIKNVSEDLKGEAINGHFIDTVRYYAAYAFFVVIYWIILLLPAIYIVVYLLFGRDRAMPVEEEVMSPPERREPWVVNYIFKNEGTQINYERVIIATLLELQRKEMIKISDDGKKILILRDDIPDGIEDYEANVFEYLKSNSEDDIFQLDKRPKTSPFSSDNFGGGNMLIIDSETKEKVFEKFIYLPDNRIGFTFIFGLAYLFAAIGCLLLALPYGIYPLVGMSLTIPYFVQVFGMWHYIDVLGRWKDDYYREKLRWDKFCEFLSNEDKVREKYSYFREYLDDWLIYGYALGVGKHVSRALSAPEINYPLARAINNSYPLIVTAIPISSYVESSGGGFGGGFGGGGAGAR